jgi:hypothetical protein
MNAVVLDLWHGTNQRFDRFDPALLGLATANGASRRAFFFAADPDTAWDYAQSAARKLIPDHLAHEKKLADLLKQAESAERRRDFRAYERLVIEAEELEADAINADPSGARVLQCRIRLENPFEIDGTDRRVVVDLAAVLDAAQAAGHDGVILKGIEDTPSGAGCRDDHVAVFDVEKIEIIASHDRRLDPFEQENDDFDCLSISM